MLRLLHCHPERSEGPTHFAYTAMMCRFLAGLLTDVQGAAILEFAVALPILVVFVVGIYDFSAAFNQKQKIEQAAQEAAILAASEPMSDIASGNANPASLQAVAIAVYNSLVASGVLPTGTCSPPGTASGPTGLTWTYKIKNCNPAHTADDLVITINRGWVSTSSTPASVGTVVTVQYTYYWQFNSIIQLLFPGSNSYAPTTLLTEAATAHNQT